MKRFVVVCFLVVLGVFSGEAKDAKSKSTITVAWSANTEPDLAGYVFYERIGDKHYRLALLQPSPEPTYKVKKIAPGTHYYSVTAYNLAGLESEYSEELAYTR